MELFPRYAEPDGDSEATDGTHSQKSRRLGHRVRGLVPFSRTLSPFAAAECFPFTGPFRSFFSFLLAVR